ncbi:MAG: DUF397 domain-containing protein [Nitriliruptorales bacterium]|nr:DUF397 domain-containing protein [Nitriliruptorales bacterium]
METGVNRVVALCGVQGCCPTAEFTDSEVVLRDDHDGEVRLTRDEWDAFLVKAKSGELD